jgi:acyl-coenzyme A thioesterase PaaI-like protein
MNAARASEPPCTVTAELAVALKRPTPVDAELLIVARAVASQRDWATVEAHIEVDGKVTATCRGLFAAVREGHPAFHRWG